jgi:coenzyme F420 hydrogenase subunit beta
MANQPDSPKVLPIAGQPDLAREVFDRNLCAFCGACVGPCPHFIHVDGRVILRDRCVLDDGRCWSFCPMGGARGSFEEDLGPRLDVWVARAVKSEYRKKAQYGGVVSTLAALALKDGLVSEMVLTSGHPEDPPVGVRARTKTDVLASAGSRYAASAVVATLNQALAEPGGGPLGLVGTPCQIKAASAMRSASPAQVSFEPARIQLLIGLFCTWALDYRKLTRYLRTMLFGERAFGYDIPPPPANVFKVRTGDGIKAFPLDEIRPFRLNACGFCDDLTAARADVSVGSVEGLDGWNTVIIRTEAGRNLIERARERELLKVSPLPEADLDHLKEAAALKKERAALAWHVEG